MEWEVCGAIALLEHNNWNPNDPQSLFLWRIHNTVEQIKTIDSTIICEFAIDETIAHSFHMGNSHSPLHDNNTILDTLNIVIPDWAWDVLTLSEQNNLAAQGYDRNDNITDYFDYLSLVYSTSELNELNSYGANCSASGFALNITKPMTKMWYYYWGRLYIDRGVEAIRWGQMGLTCALDALRPNKFEHTKKVVDALRTYARNKNGSFNIYSAKYYRNFILITGGRMCDNGLARINSNSSIPEYLVDMYSIQLGVTDTDTRTISSTC